MPRIAHRFLLVVRRADDMQPLLRFRLFSATAALSILAASIFSSERHDGPSAAEAIPKVERPPPDARTDDPRSKNFVSGVSRASICYYVGSKIVSGPGAGRSTNFPQCVTQPNRASGLYLLAQPGVVTTWKQSVWESGREELKDRPGMRIALVNRTDKLVKFPALDSRLYMVLQARDPDGLWKALHSRASCDCPASRHYVYLEPDHYWEIAAPRFAGSFATKLRAALLVDEHTMIYSNEFDGSINLEQLPKKRHPAMEGIVDSFNEW